MKVNRVKVLDDLMKHKEFTSKAEFARFLEVKPNVLSNWYNRNSYDEEILQQKFPEVNKIFILTGEGGMLLNKDSVKSHAIKNIDKTELATVEKGVPYFDIDFSGGWNSGELFTTQRPSLYINNPEFYSCDFACNLSGQSISNSIPAGAIVGFKEIQDWKTYFSGGEFYGVVTKNDLRTVKIVKKIKGNKEALLLVPDPSLEYKGRFDEEEIPIDFIIGFYQVVAWAQFERLVM